MAIYALQSFEPELPVDGSAWVAPNATLIGRVRLAPNASVWFGAVLRGDNEWITIGGGSNVQDNSVFHADPGIPAIVGCNVTIGHAVVFHGATVGDNCIIGMGATLLNNARVGANSIVGAHALLPEGKDYPERSLIVGVPGRVVRALTDDEVAMLPRAAARYVANAKRFREQLREIQSA